MIMKVIEIFYVFLLMFIRSVTASSVNLLMLKYHEVDPVPVQIVKPELFCLTSAAPSMDNL